MVRSLGGHCRRCIVQQLRFLNRLDLYLCIECLKWCCVQVVLHLLNALIKVLGCFAKEVLLGSRLSIITRRDEQREIIFNVSESIQYFLEFD